MRASVAVPEAKRQNGSRFKASNSGARIGILETNGCAQQKRSSIFGDTGRRDFAIPLLSRSLWWTARAGGGLFFSRSTRPRHRSRDRRVDLADAPMLCRALTLWQVADSIEVQRHALPDWSPSSSPA